MSDASVPSNFFHFRQEEGGSWNEVAPERTEPRLDEFSVGHFSFLRLMAVEIWAFYVCTNGVGTCEVSCWFCVPVFEAGLTGAQWWNCGKMWDGGKAGVGEKKFGLFQGDEGGEGGRAAALNIFLRDNRSRVSSRSCCWRINLSYLSFEVCGWEIEVWTSLRWEMCRKERKEISLYDRYLVRLDSWDFSSF